MSQQQIDPREFAERVERLCDFILSQAEGRETDLNIIHKLKEDAADIQAKINSFSGISLTGLDEHMRGLTTPK